METPLTFYFGVTYNYKRSFFIGTPAAAPEFGSGNRNFASRLVFQLGKKGRFH